MEVIRMVFVINDVRVGFWFVGGGNEMRGNLEVFMCFLRIVYREEVYSVVVGF